MAFGTPETRKSLKSKCHASLKFAPQSTRMLRYVYVGTCLHVILNIKGNTTSLRSCCSQILERRSASGEVQADLHYALGLRIFLEAFPRDRSQCYTRPWPWPVWKPSSSWRADGPGRSAGGCICMPTSVAKPYHAMASVG